MRDNIIGISVFGFGPGLEEGVPTLKKFFSPYRFEHNLIINNTRSSDQSRGESFLKDRYPEGTIVVPGNERVGFYNLSIADDYYRAYEIGPFSPYFEKKSGERPLGADFDSLRKALNGLTFIRQF
jgi:hypothetical protein